MDPERLTNQIFRHFPKRKTKPAWFTETEKDLKETGITAEDLQLRDTLKKKVEEAGLMPSKREIRLIMLHEFKLGRNAAEATRNINRAWGEGSTSESRTRRWFQKFRIGDFRLEDEEGRGRPSAVDDSELKVIIEADPYKTTREVAKELSVDHSTIARHLKQIGRNRGKRLREETPDVKPTFLEGWGDEIEIIETTGES